MLPYRCISGFKKSVMAISTIATLASAAHAVPLAPGGSVLTPGTSVAARPELAGTVVYDNMVPFTVKSTGGVVIATGQFQDRVDKETGTGTLDFYYRLISDTSSTGNVTLNTRQDFAPFTTDVDFLTDCLVTNRTHQTKRNPSANLVGFSYDTANYW